MPRKILSWFCIRLDSEPASTYEVQSNKESGQGRYDVMLIPKDRSQLAIVMEFKTLRNAQGSLVAAVQQALQQIIDRNYAASLRSKGIRRILQIGLAFYQKKRGNRGSGLNSTV